MGSRGRFWRAIRDENGATLVEYSFVLGLIAAVALSAVAATGVQVANLWQNSSAQISGSAANAGGPPRGTGGSASTGSTGGNQGNGNGGGGGNSGQGNGGTGNSGGGNGGGGGNSGSGGGNGATP